MSPTATAGPRRFRRTGSRCWLSVSSTISSRESSERPAAVSTASKGTRAAGGAAGGATAAAGSVTVRRWSTARFSKVCTAPLGHVTAIRRMTVSLPSPKWSMGSLEDM